MASLLTGTTIAGNTAWHSGNDGAGSGLDADTLDGTELSAICRAGQSVILVGDVTASGSVGQGGAINLTTTVVDRTAGLHFNRNIYSSGGSTSNTRAYISDASDGYTWRGTLIEFQYGATKYVMPFNAYGTTLTSYFKGTVPVKSALTSNTMVYAYLVSLDSSKGEDYYLIRVYETDGSIANCSILEVWGSTLK